MYQKRNGLARVQPRECQIAKHANTRADNAPIRKIDKRGFLKEKKNLTMGNT
jgi:hypothetical protein